MTDDFLKLKKRKTLNNQVYETLKEAILNGYLKPGQRLRQDHLSEQMGVSRMPLREAFNKLEMQGLVTVVPHKGAMVAKFSRDELQDIYMIRSLLEGHGTMLAIQKVINEKQEDLLDDMQKILESMEHRLEKGDLKEMVRLNHTFHKTIYQGSGSKRLYQMITNLWDSFPKYSISLFQVHARQSQMWHRKIMDAFLAKDPEKGKEYMEEHIRISGEVVFDFLKEKNL